MDSLEMPPPSPHNISFPGDNRKKYLSEQFSYTELFFKRMATLIIFYIMFYKVNSFCDFLFVFLHTKPNLKRGLF